MATKLSTRSTSSKDSPGLSKTDSTDPESVTLKDMERMIDKTVRKLFEEFKLEIRSEMKLLFAQHLEGLETRVKDIETDLNDKSEKLIALEIRVDNIISAPKDENTALQPALDGVMKVARQATIMANDCEQYSRRNNIRIRGLKVPTGDSCVESVAKWINTSLKLSEVSPDDIGAAHPLPTKRTGTDSSHPPTIIVRFNKREMRDRVISARKTLKHTDYSVADDLTSLNMQLINRLKEDDRISDAWSWQGKIFAKLARNDKIVKARPFQTVDDLCK